MGTKIICGSLHSTRRFSTMPIGMLLKRTAEFGLSSLKGLPDHTGLLRLNECGIL